MQRPILTKNYFGEDTGRIFHQVTPDIALLLFTEISGIFYITKKKKWLNTHQIKKFTRDTEKSWDAVLHIPPQKYFHKDFHKIFP